MAPYHAVWRGTDRHWLDWQRGDIFTKYPHRELIEKMIPIAQELDAKVQDDDGEVYLAAFDKYEPTLEQRQSWGRKFFGK